MDEKIRNSTNELLDQLYHTKTKEEWETVMVTIRELANDVTPNDKVYWVEWVKNRVDKMKSFKEKYWDRPQFPKKETFLLRPEEGKAFIDMCNSISNYFKNKKI